MVLQEQERDLRWREQPPRGSEWAACVLEGRGAEASMMPGKLDPCRVLQMWQGVEGSGEFRVGCNLLWFRSQSITLTDGRGGMGKQGG